jgi:hypothetical protein
MRRRSAARASRARVSAFSFCSIDKQYVFEGPLRRAPAADRVSSRAESHSSPQPLSGRRPARRRTGTASCRPAGCRSPRSRCLTLRRREAWQLPHIRRIRRTRTCLGPQYRKSSSASTKSRISDTSRICTSRSSSWPPRLRGSRTRCAWSARALRDLPLRHQLVESGLQLTLPDALVRTDRLEAPRRRVHERVDFGGGRVPVSRRAGA